MSTIGNIIEEVGNIIEEVRFEGPVHVLFRLLPILLVGLVLVFVLLWHHNCTPTRTNGGGTATVTVPVGEKFVNITWKNDNLWIVTRKAEPGEKPQVYHFREKSVYGAMEGDVVIQEQEPGKGSTQ
jgi:hypothetical protein